MPATQSDPGITNIHLPSRDAINTHSDVDIQSAINANTSIEGSLQDVTQDANPNSLAQNFIKFDAHSKMPPIADLQSAGLRRSPRIAANQLFENKQDQRLTVSEWGTIIVDTTQAQDNNNLANSKSSPDEFSFSQVAPGNITYFENSSNFLPVITDHADRSNMSSSDPTLATYNSVKFSDNIQQFKFLIDSLLNYIPEFQYS